MNQFYLTVKIGNKYASINIQDINETLRPLTLEAFANLPSFILGLSTIRGIQTPVMSLKKFLEGTHQENNNSSNEVKKLIWVTLKVNGLQVAIEVDSISGIFEIPTDALQNMPPLLAHAHSDSIALCGMLDNNLLLILQSTRLIPKEVWQKLNLLMSPSLQKESRS